MVTPFAWSARGAFDMLRPMRLLPRSSLVCFDHLTVASGLVAGALLLATRANAQPAPQPWPTDPGPLQPPPPTAPPPPASPPMQPAQQPLPDPNQPAAPPPATPPPPGQIPPETPTPPLPYPYPYYYYNQAPPPGLPAGCAAAWPASACSNAAAPGAGLLSVRDPVEPFRPPASARVLPGGSRDMGPVLGRDRAIVHLRFDPGPSRREGFRLQRLGRFLSHCEGAARLLHQGSRGVRALRRDGHEPERQERRGQRNGRFADSRRPDWKLDGLREPRRRIQPVGRNRYRRRDGGRPDDHDTRRKRRHFVPGELLRQGIDDSAHRFAFCRRCVSRSTLTRPLLPERRKLARQQRACEKGA